MPRSSRKRGGAQDTTGPPEYPNPFTLDDSDTQIFTLIELRMRTLVGEIIGKPNWTTKVREAEIVKKWRIEFVKRDAALVRQFWPEKSEQQDEYEADEEDDINDNDKEDEEESWQGRRKLWPCNEITEAQLNYAFGWLDWLARTRDEETGIEPTHLPSVYQSHSLIPRRLTEALLQHATILEAVPDADKDWHPGSNNQVLDLIHPSLHCFRIGKSIVTDPETGTQHIPSVQQYLDQRQDLKVEFRQGLYKRFSVSIQHQWLPTDFAISSSGVVTHLSYINNLHPDRYTPLYSTINSILERFIPLWERVLSDLLSPKLIIEADPYQWYDEHTAPEPVREDFDEQYPDSETAAWDAYDEACEKWRDEREPYIPDPAPFSPPNAADHPRVELKGRDIQVIVKMANIMLTPENPKYNGGSWHVEGMENERIVATGIYYYDSSNVTESKLGFRAALGDDMDMPYQQGDYQGYWMAYGVDGEGGALNQELGHMITKQGKCLAFPNVWQHRVSPFKLQDPSKPGHRKILCFFLVDPNVSVLSTAIVPPQQQDWYVREMQHVPVMKWLPQELLDLIAEHLVNEGQGVMTMETAKQERAKLMEERAKVVIEQNEIVFELKFNMCEH